jgi:hypothetical protein
MHNEVNKKYSLGGYSVGITDGSNFFQYTTEMASDGKLYVPSYMKIGSGIK